jgi:limonene 1,2-monooxygenase
MHPDRMQFGIFMAPFHRKDENPTLALRRDLDLISWLDELGFDEVWAGEHHSGGWETSASPEVFLAAAGERTQRIRLGTGVVSLPYHNPFLVADRIVLLDHLTRGRAMLGVGPGALAADASFLGLQSTRQREMMDESLGIIMRLLNDDEPVTYETDWFELHEAQLQLKPVQRPLPVAVASTISPAGMSCAGKHGAGVLSVALYSEEGLMAMPTQWGFCETAAQVAGRPAPDRGQWRVVAPFHLAETKEQAIQDVMDGMKAWNNDYFVNTLGAPFRTEVESGRTLAEDGAFGMFVCTPENAIAGIKRLHELSGGFGCFLGLAHEWADREKTLHSYELFARYVMPAFQDSLTWLDRSNEWTRANKERLASAGQQAVVKAIQDHAAAHPQPPGGA